VRGDMTKGKVNVQKFSTLNKKDQLAIRKEAYKRWAVNADNNVSRIKNIANALGMTYKEIIHYKEKDKWLERYEKDKVLTQKEIDKKAEEIFKRNKIKASTKDINEILDNAGIPDKWQLFIMYYLHSYNAYQAAYKAGYSTKNNAVAYTILNDERTKKAIKAIKEIMAVDLNLTAHDIIDMYKSAAFSDLTNVYEVGKTGWLKVKSLEGIDGRLIQEIKQGKDGIAIKLIDKKWALERLEKLFDIIPDKRLELDHKKYELNKKLVEKQLGEDTSNNKVIIINDL
jgi:phage terminase small subunit